MCLIYMHLYAVAKVGANQGTATVGGCFGVGGCWVIVIFTFMHLPESSIKRAFRLYILHYYLKYLTILAYSRIYSIVLLVFLL